MRTLILIAFGFSGAAALIYEVVWTRELSLVLGSTTYALSTMLATFMAGLALGAAIGGRIADRQGRNLLAVFGLMELGIGVFGLITIPIIHMFSPLYLKIYHTFHIRASTYFAVQFVMCAGVMLIPTTLMGATFPVVSRAVTGKIDELGRRVGSAYSFNTVGAIGGSFAAGFILIPLAGAHAATVVAASLNVIVAVTVLVASRIRRRAMLAAGVLIAVSATAALSVASYEPQWVPNIYLANRFETHEDFVRSTEEFDVLFDRDYREGRVRLWRDAAGFTIVQVGGKIEGTGPRDITNTHLLAYLPIAAHPEPRSALVIGLGAGVTLQAVKEHVGDVHMAEINEGVIHAIEEFGKEGLLDGVKVEVNDARNYLLLTGRKFDIISSEPSYPTDSPTGNLFTVEFYRLASERLSAYGVFSQWLPYHLLSNDDITMMLRTFGSVFDYVYLWKAEDSLDLIMLGSKLPFSLSTDELVEKTRELNVRNVRLNFRLSRDPHEVRKIIEERRDIPLNTDNHPLLEFHAARNLITGVRE